MWKKLFSAGALGLLLFPGASTVPARELTGRSFGGDGWNQSATANSVALPVSFAGVSRGSISFDLRRSGDAHAAGGETVFALLDRAGVQVLRMQVDWAAAAGQGNPQLHFRGPGQGEEYRRHGIGLWGPVVILDQPVAAGESIHVDLTWDDEARRYAVLVNGRQQLRQSGGEGPGKSLTPEMQEQINRELERQGRPKAFDSRPLGAFISGVVSVQLGSFGPPLPSSIPAIPATTALASRPALASSRTPAPATRRPILRNTFIDNFVVYGDEIPPSGHTALPAEMTIASVQHNSRRASGFSGKLVAGNTLDVQLSGTPGATASFDIAHYPDLDRSITLDWRGWGVDLGENPFPEKGDVNLRDVEGYLVYASREPFNVVAPALEPAARLEVREQSHTLKFLEIDTPYYVAVLATMRDGTLRPILSPILNRPLVEYAPGEYSGSQPVGYQDRYPRAVVVGYLARGDAKVSQAGDAKSAFAVDPALRIAVATEPHELKADEQSKAKVTVIVTDANGNSVPGHKIKFLLATTSQYTGVVGGGAFKDQVGGSLSESAWGQTDLFGRITATYVAGFAAKTAVIVARDMASNDTGAGYVRTAIQATAQLQLLSIERQSLLATGYEITVTSSDQWLTADGRSQARIAARVTLGGRPVEGHHVDFSVSSGSGSIRAVRDLTDRNGEARAIYTAGKKIGVALITAADSDAGISGSVQIELRSDAPAKIKIKLDPEKLPADGHSRADLLVLVTDINDNPNDNVEVEYELTEGSGSLRHNKGLTDRRGEALTNYTAGRSPGKVSIEITVRSPVPTAEEMAKARDLALAVPDSRYY